MRELISRAVRQNLNENLFAINVTAETCAREVHPTKSTHEYLKMGCHSETELKVLIFRLCATELFNFCYGFICMVSMHWVQLYGRYALVLIVWYVCIGFVCM